MNRFEMKLARMREGNDTRKDFILADAKDADTAGGLTSMGRRLGVLPAGVSAFRSRAEFLDDIRRIIKQDVVDIVLGSASNIEALLKEDAFAQSGIQHAVRMNDTSDLWRVRGATFGAQPSVPFRSASLKRVQAPIGLYSLTFNGEADHDAQLLERFAAFREEAIERGFTYFLEVFNPIEGKISPSDYGSFLNDMITRLLAGLCQIEQPAFLKIAFNGGGAISELAQFDPATIIGIMGGGSGTSRDCFELLHQAQKHGARAALFGRKIVDAEEPVSFIGVMRKLLDGVYGPVEAVHDYHDALERANLSPIRNREADLTVTEELLRPEAA
ncbi:hypothetical protein AA103196_2613 [Ameyamaea chiangmaiensis NBRC 103196]|uniref:Uncharacterized protein n=1 Tax=Ameyamaea chiangmaiensis TaxID=442969 RepID=A0A850P6M1_9PROT|nr:hypothetical protein [Ameyamaea chiangmaiensis]MBS4075586.1 hypothetical protein [Ameyamaea chiangmaiensis]NVN40285.1 hypothetical protein [Ameyamaea chiangmaiensis]GBQ70855.1 hypothetical protein AA103196_2613 [Ameyamaea chiangmaiensis NBRC 103196]